MCKKVFAYCRVSTSEKCAKQSYERQYYLINKCGLNVDKVFEEHISGGVKGNQREQFNKMLEETDEDTLILVAESSRFGRNYIDCFEMLDIITQEKKASVKFLSNGMELKGGLKMDCYQWLTLSNFFIMDEFLKRQIGMNTSNALQAKKAQGIRLGRPQAEVTDLEIEVAREYESGEFTMEQLAERYGLSKSKVARTIRKIKGEQNGKS